MRIIAIIQVRMKSTRLPGKVLLPIMGRPMLQLMIERLRYSKRLNEIVVATTTDKIDDSIISLAKKLEVGWYRGSEKDVLSRVLQAARKYSADLIVELTGDCPLVDPAMIDEMIEDFQRSGVDYLANNTIKQLIPRGFDIQIFSKEILEKVNRLTNDVYDHEHVSLYIYEHPEKFKIKHWGPEKKLQRSDLRLTVDTALDFELIKRVFHLLYINKPNFTLEDTITIFEQFPGLAEINKKVEQKKARYTRAEDKKWAQKVLSGIYNYTPKLKAAIVGCGNIVDRFDNDSKRLFISMSAGAFQKNKDISLVAACDVDKNMLETFGARWSLDRLYTDFKKMFKEVKPDIVSVCATLESHYYKIVEAAIENKIPIVICEKPFENNLLLPVDLAYKVKKSRMKLIVHSLGVLEVSHKRSKDMIESIDKLVQNLSILKENDSK